MKTKQRNIGLLHLHVLSFLKPLKGQQRIESVLFVLPVDNNQDFGQENILKLPAVHVTQEEDDGSDGKN